jgi:hypothetical protein
LSRSRRRTGEGGGWVGGSGPPPPAQAWQHRGCFIAAWCVPPLNEFPMKSFSPQPGCCTQLDVVLPVSLILSLPMSFMLLGLLSLLQPRSPHRCSSRCL